MKKNVFLLAASLFGATAMMQGADISPMRKACAPADLSELEAISATARANDSSQHPGEKMLMKGVTMPHSGEPKVPVVIIQFEDCMITTENANALYTGMLNQEGFTNDMLPGSMRDYYIDNSHGKFKPQFDVYGPVTVNRKGTLKGYYINHPATAVLDACYKLCHESNVDFSQYDSDGDYLVDNVIVVFAGLGYGDYGAPEVSFQPHNGNAYNGGKDPSIDNGNQISGVYVGSYSLTPEYAAVNYGASKRNDISSMIHEFSHAMGLPDFYPLREINPVDYYWTPGDWNIMDIGCYLEVPPSYSSLERYMFGWIEPEIATLHSSVTLEPVTSSNHAIIISSESNKRGHEEFYLLEARDKNTGKWDAKLPGSGLLIWHIDYYKQKWDADVPNQDHTCPGVDLMRADGKYSPYGSELGSNPYPGISGEYTSFTPYSTYGSEYDTTFSKYPITNIRRVGSPAGSIAFDIAGGSAGIDGIGNDENISYKYYDMRGIEVDPATAAAGMYIRRGSDGNSAKIIVR